MSGIEILATVFAIVGIFALGVVILPCLLCTQFCEDDEIDPSLCVVGFLVYIVSLVIVMLVQS